MATPSVDGDGSVHEEWRTVALGEMHSMLATAVPLEVLLDTIVHRAAERVGDSASAAITLRLRQQPTVAAATDERSAECDRVEQAAGAGPCLEATVHGGLITVPEIAAADRWAQWREASLAAGFGSAAALPASLAEEPDLELAINLYRPEPGEWDEATLADVQAFAEDAGRALAVAARVEEQARVNADLKQAMASRTTIDQALGVIMAQNRCSPEEAFAILRRASQHRNAKLRDVAAQIVTRVSGAEPHSANEFRDRPGT
ncbi:ANTAR domain-containing protein [Cellulomonas endometrii]|uniref:ANTAR domain-containing protein n=1 Tax=Cellulomonas endometrii TaxID=3036301 RepID=UPI0024ADA84C|nr:ANTAR domain-containing protein [Cellulomonas endometrii]